MLARAGNPGETLWIRPGSGRGRFPVHRSIRRKTLALLLPGLLFSSYISISGEDRNPGKESGKQAGPVTPFDETERETLMYICTKSMAPEFGIAEEEKKTAFCGCVVDGWEKEVRFPRIILTFMKIGNGDINENHPDSVVLMKPMLTCALVHGAIPLNGSKADQSADQPGGEEEATETPPVGQ